MKVEFRNYGQEIAFDDLYICLVQGLAEVADILIQNHGDHGLGDDHTWVTDAVEIYVENLFTVDLKVMTWWSAAQLLAAIGEFAHQYRFTSSEFSIYEPSRGARSIGDGHVTTPHDVVANAANVQTS